MIEIDDKIGINTSKRTNNNVSNFGSYGEQRQAVIMPKKVKLELTTSMEAFAQLLLLLSGVPTIIVYVNNYQSKIPLFNVLSISLTAVTCLAFIFYRNVDEYYVLDSSRQALMLKSKIFSNEKYVPFAPFSSIHAVVANGRYNSGGKNQPSYWTYRAEIVLNTGKVVPIDDWHRENLSSADRKAQKFSEIANVTYVKGNAKCRAKLVKMGSKYTFDVKKRTFAEAALLFLLPVIILPLIVGIVAAIDAWGW